MSRHKNFRGMNLDAELDDFDGEDYYEEGDSAGMSPADKAQMANGLRRVREVVGHDVPNLTDALIEESLWYYYFDVGKTVTYLLNQQAATSKENDETKATNKGIYNTTTCENLFPRLLHHEDSANIGGVEAISRGSIFVTNTRSLSPHFWDDAPWGNIDSERFADLQPLPICHPAIRTTGLLGGSSIPSGGKTSKLAALAKAKSKAKADKLAATSTAIKSDEVKTSISLLDKLSTKKDPTPINTRPTTAHKAEETTSADSQITHETLPIAPQPTKVLQKSDDLALPENIPQAPPSGFASSMFGSRKIEEAIVDLSEKLTNARLSYFSVAPTPKAANNAKQGFAGPSPDDVVTIAQNQSKGLEPRLPKP